MTSQRWRVVVLCGALMSALSGCAVYPLPYQSPHVSGPEVNASNYAELVPGYTPSYAPVGTYGSVHGGYAYGGQDPAWNTGAQYGGDHLAPHWRGAQLPQGQGVYGTYGAYGPYGASGAYGAYGADLQGQVVDIQPIRHRANPAASSAAGTAIGGLIGGAIGNAHGHRGWRANNTVAGVMVGALLGSAIATAASHGTVYTVGYRVTARMDSGQLRSIDYAQLPNVRVGQRVGFDGQQFYR